jgi:TetR/AcrR family transcriptional repressor of nem operon
LIVGDRSGRTKWQEGVVRYTAEHKEETHRKIVRTASRAFRRHGLHGVGIADLMKKAGLTHGGFYAHFTDRDTLVEEATAAGYEEAAERLLNDLAQVPSEDAARRLVDRYLSPSHRANVEHGCPLPALAADMSRQPPRVRRAFTTRFRRYSGRLAALLPSRGRQPQHARQDTALALLSGMAGAMLLARAVSDPELSDRILAAARRFYLDALENGAEHTKEHHEEHSASQQGAGRGSSK